jgi:hypothetical protein
MCDIVSVLVRKCKVEAELNKMLMEFIPLGRDISVLLNVIYSSNVLSNTIQFMLIKNGKHSDVGNSFIELIPIFIPTINRN